MAGRQRGGGGGREGRWFSSLNGTVVLPRDWLMADPRRPKVDASSSVFVFENTLERTVISSLKTIIDYHRRYVKRGL